MSLLAALREGGQLRAVDLALADTLQRLDPDTPDLVLAAAALASNAVAQGHAAFDPAQARTLVDAELPPADAWAAALRASRWVASPENGGESDPARPLVFERGLLYLRRYREYERRLAAGLHRLAAQADDEAAIPEALFAALFPEAPIPTPSGPAQRAGRSDGPRGSAAQAGPPHPPQAEEGPQGQLNLLPPRAGEGRDGGAPGQQDAQAIAARLALSRKLALVTGGPGTGKTTTIARVLLLLLAQARDAGLPPLRIALAAPTGRAAERMAESLRNAIAQLRGREGVDAALLDALPQRASTLHRLLGAVPDSPQLRFGAGRPLPCDVVVVDEASMVDLPLMCKLVEAVADGARLLLLGDPDQLPSVEAGDVLAAIASAATGTSHDAPLTGHLVHLHRGWRQSASLQLAPLSAAVRDGDADAALALLRDGALSGVHFHEEAHDPLRGDLRDRLLPAWRALQDCEDPAEALRLAARQRLLTVRREGPQGAATLNARIESRLAGAQREPYFHGRLLLVTRNSPRHRLSNGDIGICLRDDAGALVAWFPGADGEVRGFHPAALPAHDSAFAMTVHKAQGSEFDSVWLLLPARSNRVLSRELVYTGITRARSELHLAASEDILREALSRHAGRWSGLGWRLGGDVAG
jgi:exodeoxyribonuclease V alpha subunit